MSKTYHQFVLMLLGVVMFMETLDSSILNTVLPPIALSLRVNPIDLKVAITTYLLALAAFIPAATWIADKYGIKKVIVIAVIGFTLSSVLCGLATSLWSLVTARTLQGMFGAFMLPIARLAIVRLFRTNITETLAKVAPVLLMGRLVGPVLGGLITHFGSWRAVFFVNFPVGVILLFLFLRYFPDLPKQKTQPFDAVGFCLMGLGLASMLFSIDVIVEPKVSWQFKLLFLLFGLGLLAIYVPYAKRKTFPVIELGVFNNPLYRQLLLISWILRLFGLGLGFIIPLYVQTQRGYNPIQAALVFVPVIIGAILSKFALKTLSQRFSTKALLVGICINLIVLQLCLIWQMQAYWLGLFIALTFWFGINTSLAISIINGRLYQSLSVAELNSGISLNNIAIQLSGSFCVAIIALILIVSSGSYNLAWHQVVPAFSFSTVFAVDAVFMFVLLLMVLRLPALPLNTSEG